MRVSLGTDRGNPMRIYQAGPLFTAAEIRWHQDFKQPLTDAGYEVQWPGDFFSRSGLSIWQDERQEKLSKAVYEVMDVVKSHC